jgi:hypothetical protein
MKAVRCALAVALALVACSRPVEERAAKPPATPGMVRPTVATVLVGGVSYPLTEIAIIDGARFSRIEMLDEPSGRAFKTATVYLDEGAFYSDALPLHYGSALTLQIPFELVSSVRFENPETDETRERVRVTLTDGRELVGGPRRMNGLQYGRVRAFEARQPGSNELLRIAPREVRTLEISHRPDGVNEVRIVTTAGKTHAGLRRLRLDVSGREGGSRHETLSALPLVEVPGDLGAFQGFDAITSAKTVRLAEVTYIHGVAQAILYRGSWTHHALTLETRDGNVSGFPATIENGIVHLRISALKVIGKPALDSPAYADLRGIDASLNVDLAAVSSIEFNAAAGANPAPQRSPPD